MPSDRRLAATVLVSSVLWVGLGAVGSAVAYSGSALSAVTALVLPPTVPTPFLFRPPPTVLVTLLVAGTLHAAVLALLLRVVLRRAAPGVVTAWFAVVVTSFVATGLLVLGSLIGDPGTTRLRLLISESVQLMAPAGLWGVVWGWAPALVGARRRSAHMESGRTRRAPAVLAAIVAAAVALLLLPSLDRQQAPVEAVAPSPAPSITHFGWAGIPPQSSFPAPSNACDTDDVTITAGGADAATGHRSLGIRAVNRSERACVLNGYADIVFDDQEGDAMNPLVVHGGSFMTTDAGPERVRLAPGEAAVAALGWNAQSPAGGQRAGTLYVSVLPGADRVAAPVDLDLTDSGSVALTAWEPAQG